MRLKSWKLYFSNSYYIREFYDIDRPAIEISCYTIDNKNHYEAWYYDGITDNWKRLGEFYNLYKAAIFADLYLMKLGYKIDKPFVIGDTDEGQQEEGDGESP